MAGEISNEMGCMAILKTLGRDEILEVLAEGLCKHCDAALQARILQSLPKRKLEEASIVNNRIIEHSPVFATSEKNSSSLIARPARGSKRALESALSIRRNRRDFSYSPRPMKSRRESIWSSSMIDGFSEEEEHIRFAQVGRKEDFVYIERIKGKAKNVLQGLELHTEVFNYKEQKNIIDYIYNLQQSGQNGQLRARTYSEPRKWMRGKGRVTIQFGCCYNYAQDKDGNPPGILRVEEVDPLPPLFKEMIRRMVRWHVLPPNYVPDSCIVNIYEEGDCIPPHIDHHDFVRPFCTVSLLSECNILFGANLKVVAPGEFDGPVSIPLPLGSVLILNGNAANVAKHCVPGVPSSRISITFRKMDQNKVPYNYMEDPELTGIRPLVLSPLVKTSAYLGPGENEEATHAKYSKYQASAKTTIKGSFHRGK